MRERETPHPARSADVFGDVLPETTRDERDDQREDNSDDHERWLRDNRPPHHGSLG